MADDMDGIEVDERASKPPSHAFGIIGFARNDEVTTHIHGLAGVATGNDARIEGGLLVAAVGDDARVTGVTGVLLAGNQVSIDAGVVGVLVAGETSLGEDVRVLLGPAQALAFGAAFGAAFALITFGLQRLVGR